MWASCEKTTCYPVLSKGYHRCLIICTTYSQFFSQSVCLFLFFKLTLGKGPRMIWTFLNLGKIGNIMAPFIGPHFGKIWYLVDFKFGERPSEKHDKNINSKHLKLPIFCTTETFKDYIWIWEKPENLDSQNIKIMNWGLFDFRHWSPHPFWNLFSPFGTFYFGTLPLEKHAN